MRDEIKWLIASRNIEDLILGLRILVMEYEYKQIVTELGELSRRTEGNTKVIFIKGKDCYARIGYSIVGIYPLTQFEEDITKELKSISIEVYD